MGMTPVKVVIVTTLRGSNAAGTLSVGYNTDQ
jgi:hypothetical protein